MFYSIAFCSDWLVIYPLRTGAGAGAGTREARGARGTRGIRCAAAPEANPACGPGPGNQFRSSHPKICQPKAN